MLGNFFKYYVSFHSFLPNILLIYNLNVKQIGSQMKPHILLGFIWIIIVCKDHQQSSKFTASGLNILAFLISLFYVALTVIHPQEDNHLNFLQDQDWILQGLFLTFSRKDNCWKNIVMIKFFHFQMIIKSTMGLDLEILKLLSNKVNSLVYAKPGASARWW